MLVTKNRMYKELNRVMDQLIDLSLINLDHTEELEDIRNDIKDIKGRINYTLQKVIDLTDRVDALEAKKQHKTTKKQTKKTKGK